MTPKEKQEIELICKEFTKGLDMGEISGSGWVIVDPLSAYLNACKIENTLQQLPANDKHPLILIMTFKDGTQLIPAGSDTGIEGAADWQWIDKN